MKGLRGTLASASNLTGIRGGSSGGPSGCWIKGYVGVATSHLTGVVVSFGMKGAAS